MDVAGRGALVTGGAVRLGSAVSRALAAQGANVFIHYNQSREAAATLQEEIRAAGGTAEIGASDLSDPSQGASLVQTASEAIGPISILVNSASGFPKDTIEGLTPGSWQEAQTLTLGAPVFLTQAMSVALAEGDEGAIVNVTDTKTARPDLEHFSYGLAKGGVDALTRASALALAPTIRVNAIALGNILAPSGDESLASESGEALAPVGGGFSASGGEENHRNRELALAVPLQRMGGADVVSEAVLFLVTNDFMTGEIIRLDGGAHLL